MPAPKEGAAPCACAGSSAELLRVEDPEAQLLLAEEGGPERGRCAWRPRPAHLALAALGCALLSGLIGTALLCSHLQQARRKDPAPLRRLDRSERLYSRNPNERIEAEKEKAPWTSGTSVDVDNFEAAFTIEGGDSNSQAVGAERAPPRRDQQGKSRDRKSFDRGFEDDPGEERREGGESFVKEFKDLIKDLPNKRL